MKNISIDWKLTDPQDEAMEYLEDDSTNELLFGGGAGGAKSHLGCSWLIQNCIEYPGTRWVMGRAVLKRLRETTLNTFFEICKAWELEKDVVWKYNSIEGTIKFWNGSEILLKDLFAYPSDPNFDALGSLEITGAFIDEANEVTAKARAVLSSRIRYKLDEYGLIPKLLMTCNPAKNWVYSEFYKPWRNDTLPKHRAFVQALATDNPFVSPHYIENLRKLPKEQRERLLLGNWEFDDDPARLLSIDEINDLFTNTAEASTEKYLSCDVSRFGEDKTTIGVWDGLRVRLSWKKKQSTTETAQTIREACASAQIGFSRVVVDEDGVGGGVVDQLPADCKGFLNGSSPIQPTEAKHDPTKKVLYANLKTQCAFKFAELARQRKIRIECDDEVRDWVIQELEQLKQDKIDTEGKICMVKKDHIKQAIGRSPDFMDCLIMRMYFEVQPRKELAFFEL